MSKDEKYLILGAARGGTTIIAAALGAHPRVCVLDEDMSGAFSRITGGKIAGVKLCVPNQIDLDRKWHWIYSPGMIGGFFRKSLFMSKIPKSVMSIRDYDRYGKIRPICILREPAGVINGIMKRENRSFAVASYRWIRCFEVFKALADDEAYDPVYVSFEALVKQPEVTLRALCERLGIEFSDEMLAAPERNARYQGAAFDASKAEYADAEEMWARLPADARALYDSVRALCVI